MIRCDVLSKGRQSWSLLQIFISHITLSNVTSKDRWFYSWNQGASPNLGCSTEEICLPVCPYNRVIRKMVQYPSDSCSSASGSVYKIKKAPYMSPDHNSSACRKSDSDLKDIITQKDDAIENEPPRHYVSDNEIKHGKEVIFYFRTAIPSLYIDDITLHVNR